MYLENKTGPGTKYCDTPKMHMYGSYQSTSSHAVACGF